MVCACRFVNTSQWCVHVVLLTRLGGWLGCLAHGVTSGLGHTLKALPEATIGCEVLLRRRSGRWAPLVTIELPGIGKAQSPYGSCHATFPACLCIALSWPTVLCHQLQLLYASWIAHLIPVPTQYGKKGFGEEENVIGSREQKKPQSTGNSGWLVCDAVLIRNCMRMQC